MLGKILEINDSNIIVKLDINIYENGNFIGKNVIFEDNNTKIVGEVINAYSDKIEVALIGQLEENNFIYGNLIKPSFAPPSILFPIVWTILYILMGYSSYLIYDSMDCHKETCLLLYALQLFINFIWPIIFFNLQARLFAFLFIILLDIVVGLMIYCFYGVNKKAAYLNIPYFIWLIFATILNFSVYILNR